MTSQYNSIGFKELLGLSKDKLRALPTNKLVEVSLKALENCDSDEYVFKFWTKEIFNIYNLEEFDKQLLHKILWAFVEYTIQAIPKIALVNITEECFDVIISNVEGWLGILNRVDANLQCTGKVLTVIVCSLKVLGCYYSFLKNSKVSGLEPSQANGLTIVMTNSQNLQRSILSIIIDYPNHFICNSITDITLVTEVLDCLIAVGKIVPGLDVRLTAEIWKSVLKISSENAPFITSVADYTFLAVGRPIQFLCEEIQKSLRDIYTVTNTNLEIVERILKICSFYLKLLLRFASDFGHEFFVDNDVILKTAIMLLSTPASLKNSKIETLIKQYLVVGFLNLINLIYKNTEFASLLCKEDTDCNSGFKPFFSLSLEVLKFLVSENNQIVLNLYLNKDENLIEKMFEGITKFPNILLEKVIYENFVITISALVLSACSSFDLINRLEKCLIRGILQNCIILANVCVDIWLTLSRFINAESRYKYVCFWFKCCSEFPLLSTAPQTVYARNLLRNLYNILPTSYKQKFWQHVSDVKAIKIALFTFDFDSIPDHTKHNNLQLQLANEVIARCEGLSTTISAEEYFALIQNVKILNIPLPPSECGIYEHVINFFTKLLKISNDKHTILHISLMMFIEKHLKMCSKSQLMNLTNLLKQYIKSSKNVTFKICVATFVGEISKLEHAGPLKDVLEFLKADTNILVRSTARSLLNDFQSPSSKDLCAFELENYLQEQSNIFSHKCMSVLEPGQNPAKKLKIDNKSAVLKQFLYDANKFASMYKDAEYSNSDLEIINEIRNIFVKIINK